MSPVARRGAGQGTAGIALTWAALMLTAHTSSLAGAGRATPSASRWEPLQARNQLLQAYLAASAGVRAWRDSSGMSTSCVRWPSCPRWAGCERQIYMAPHTACCKTVDLFNGMPGFAYKSHAVCRALALVHAGPGGHAGRCAGAHVSPPPPARDGHGPARCLPAVQA